MKVQANQSDNKESILDYVSLQFQRGLAQQWGFDNKMQGDSPREGFEEPEEEHLPSKEKDKAHETDLYFKIPQAKPILSKIIIDHRKPKILIKNIKIDLQYPQLLNAQLFPYSISFQKQPRRQIPTVESTLWRRYVLSGNYRCLYMKHHPGKLQQSERRGKKLRNQIYHNTMGNEWLLATLVVDMSFLNETTSITVRNLTCNTLLQQEQKTFQSKKEEIIFDSAFENGNLMYAFIKLEQQDPREFNLILQNDVNTKGYANWFFFKVMSAQPGPLRFHLVNLQKAFSYFSQGMKPAVYSLREGKGWKMEGYNISYYRNQLIKSQISNERYSTLSFTIDQKQPNDTLVIAASVPYTYSRLLLFLQNLEKKIKLKSNVYFRRQMLAKSISGNECPMITLTLKRDRKEDKSRKKIAVVIARQHPSEIVSSWVCEGVLEGLVSGKSESQELMRKYIFKIVPMMNVDGVIYGNSRCDISGSDCNRKWTRNSNETLFPIVTAVRKMVSELLYEGYEIEYFLDLHGHSRKLGSFMYCCRTGDDVESRIFAWLMSKITQKFIFDQCRFAVSAFRRETARGYFGALLNSRKAITLETSFFGYKTSGAVKPFLPNELRELGESLMMTVHADTFRTNGVVNWATIRNQIRQEILNRRRIQEQESSGSDSDPQGEELSAAEKATTFLSPTVASKIGLVDVKIIQKPKRNIQSFSPDLRRQNEELIRRESMGNLQNTQNHQLFMSQSLQKRDDVGSHRLIGLRETKSVTKIEPFRFKSVQKKTPGKGKRIRIAIDIQRLESREPRRSFPSLPEVRPKNRQQFWSHLQQEYQTLLTEKQSIILQAKTHIHSLKYPQ